jgi:hypothetical protein
MAMTKEILVEYTTEENPRKTERQMGSISWGEMGRSRAIVIRYCDIVYVGAGDASLKVGQDV